MIEFFIIFIYLFLAGLSIWLLSVSQLKNASIAFGALVGCVYFLAIPFGFILFYGEVTDSGLISDGYFPYEDLKTTFNFFLGWVVVISAFITEQKYRIRILNLKQKITFDAGKVFYSMIFLYFVISIYGGISTGAFTNGLHWHDSSRFESTAFLILKNFANCYRVLIFGVLLYFFENKTFSKKRIIIIGFLFVLFDLIISFNRITILYYLILLIFIYRNWYKPIILAVLFIFPLVINFSTAWTQFRGLASVNGYSISTFAEAWTEAYSNLDNNNKSAFVERMNAIFESSNLIVFHEVVENTGGKLDVQYGRTFLLRPLTTFIPSTIWQDKPKVYGVYLGEKINSYKGLALNSTLFGEAYGNFYYFWPFMLYIALIFFGLIYKFISNSMPGIAFGGVFVGVSIWRFDINFVVASLYSIAIIAFLLFVFKKVGFR